MFSKLMSISIASFATSYSELAIFSSGLCSAIGTTALMCFIFFIWRRRNRNRYGPSSSYASRSICSKSYSRSDTEKGSAYLGVHVFTYKELEQATNYFDSSKELGDGGFGTVYYGKLIIDILILQDHKVVF